ncbi:MAG: hypothetical protein ACJAWV_000543 [Flammeovirgaceae bacterium]|jgi:hypothetical protein
MCRLINAWSYSKKTGLFHKNDIWHEKEFISLVSASRIISQLVGNKALLKNNQ